MARADQILPPRIVDAHQHFWSLGENLYPWLAGPQLIPFRYGDYSPLKADYTPARYWDDVGAWPVVKTVHIEADHDPCNPLAETRWLEKVNAEFGVPSVCVGFADLEAPDADEIVAAQASRPLVRGIRNKLPCAASPELSSRGGPRTLDSPQWRQGFSRLAPHGLSFDLQTAWWHMDAATDLARDFPETQIVINHSGLPADRSPAGLQGWRKAMASVADCPNVAVKISGLGQPGHAWTIESNGPIIRDLVAMFGPDRCMFASNYPVDSLCASFDDIARVLAAAISHLEHDDQDKIFYSNAIRIYRI